MKTIGELLGYAVTPDAADTVFSAQARLERLPVPKPGDSSLLQAMALAQYGKAQAQAADVATDLLENITELVDSETKQTGDEIRADSAAVTARICETLYAIGMLTDSDYVDVGGGYKTVKPLAVTDKARESTFALPAVNGVSCAARAIFGVFQAGTEANPLGRGYLSIRRDTSASPNALDGSAYIEWGPAEVGTPSTRVVTRTNTLAIKLDGVLNPVTNKVETIRTSLDQYADDLLTSIQDGHAIETVINAVNSAGTTSTAAILTRLNGLADSEVVTALKDRLASSSEISMPAVVATVSAAIKAGSRADYAEGNAFYSPLQAPGYSTSLLVTVISGLFTAIVTVLGILFKVLGAVFTLLGYIVSAIPTLISRYVHVTTASVTESRELGLLNKPLPVPLGSWTITPGTGLVSSSGRTWSIGALSPLGDSLMACFEKDGCAIMSSPQSPLAAWFIPTQDDFLAGNFQILVKANGFDRLSQITWDPGNQVEGSSSSFNAWWPLNRGVPVQRCVQTMETRNYASSYATLDDPTLAYQLAWNVILGVTMGLVGTHVAWGTIGSQVPDGEVTNDGGLYIDFDLDVVRAAKWLDDLASESSAYTLSDRDRAFVFYAFIIAKIRAGHSFSELRSWDAVDSLMSTRFITTIIGDNSANAVGWYGNFAPWPQLEAYVVPGSEAADPNVLFPSVSRTAAITALIVTSLGALTAVASVFVLRRRGRKKAYSKVMRAQSEYDQALAEYKADPSDANLKKMMKTNRRLTKRLNKANRMGIAQINGKSTGSSGAGTVSGSVSSTLDDMDSAMTSVGNISSKAAEVSALGAQTSANEAKSVSKAVSNQLSSMISSPLVF